MRDIVRATKRVRSPGTRTRVPDAPCRQRRSVEPQRPGLAMGTASGRRLPMRRPGSSSRRGGLRVEEIESREADRSGRKAARDPGPRGDGWVATAETR